MQGWNVFKVTTLIISSSPTRVRQKDTEPFHLNLCNITSHRRWAATLGVGLTLEILTQPLQKAALMRLLPRPQADALELYMVAPRKSFSWA